MSESNVPEIIKYLTEDNLKLMYGRLNRRYLVVDALPSVDSLEPADKNVIYVVKETVGETVRYWPNVLDNDVWKPFGIGQVDLDGKADKVDAVEGHLVVADKDGNLVDADILPGTFVALAFDPDEEIQPHATDIRKVWEAFQSGIPVMLLDNRANGTGLYASLNAAGYTWPAGDEMAERLTDVDENYRPYDDSVQGYYFEGKFYDDAAHTTQIEPTNGEVYHDIATDKTYLYGDGTFTQVHRFIQFTTNELIKDEPAWTSRTSSRPVFYRIFEPVGSATANNFDVVFGESTGINKDDMTKKADKVSNAVQGHFAGLDASGNLTDSGAKASDFATAAQGRKADTALQEHQDISGKADKSAMDITYVEGDNTKKHIQLKNGLGADVVVKHQDISGKAEKSEMKVTAGDGVVKVQLKAGLSVDVITDISGKQDVIDDLEDIRSGAAAGATAYQKPGSGIPKSDLASGVQASLGKADTALQEHQDISGKADKDADAVDGNLAMFDNGNPVDSGVAKNNLVTGARIGSADPLPVEQGIIVIPESATVNDGKLSIKVGSKSPVVFTANEADDKSVTIDKSGIGLGNVDNTSDVNKPISTATQTALNKKADKVSGATNGHLAGLNASGNLTDSGKKASDFATSAQGAKADTAYQKPSGGIPKSDLASGVQASLGKADTALQEHQDISGKANKSEMTITDVSGDATKKTIQLKDGLSQDVVVEHQDISGKVDKVEGKGLSTNDFTDADKEKLDNIEASAEVNVIEKVQKNGTDLSISNKTVNVPVGTGMLKTKIGSAQSATDLFGADSSTDATLEIPMASADTTGATPVYTEGLMSGQDKEKLDGIEAGAEENDVETVSIGGGTPISPTANTTNIDIPMAGYTSGATPTYTDGAMAGQDKKKLDDLKNFSSVVISDGATPTPATTTIVPADHNSALTFKAGANVTLSAEPSTDPDTIVISATGGGGDPVTVSGGKGISVTPTVDPTTSVTDYEVSVSGAIGCIGGKSSVNVTASDCDAIALPMTDAFDSGNDRFIIQEDQTDHHVYLYALKTVSGQTPATRVDGVDMFTVTFNVNLTRSAIQSGVTQHGFYGLAGIKVLRKHSSVVTLADSSESYAAEVGAASINLTVTIQNNSGTETTIGGKAYYGYRFVYYGDAPAIDSTTQLPIETIDLVSRLTSVEETVGIAEYSGTIPTYTAGTAIDMTSDVVSVQYNRGLMVNSNNQLEVRLGEGLDYLPDPQNPAIIAIGIHNDVEEVVEEVKELETTINTTVTTNMDFADITGKFDLTGDGSHTGDGVLLGYTFTVPLANKLYLEDVANEWVTKIGVYAAQTYSQNYCIIGIYEFDFNQHPVPTTVNPSGYAGYTVPLCDTGRVKLHSGLNEFSIKHMNANGETELSFKPDCIYYAAIYVSKNCGQNLSLAGKPGYNDPFNDSLPVMSMDMCNLNLDLSDSSKTATELDAISFNDFGWWGGGSGSSQAQAYHECPNAHRFFMMVRNVKAVQSN